MLKVPSVLNLKPNILCVELGQKCPSFLMQSQKPVFCRKVLYDYFIP